MSHGNRQGRPRRRTPVALCILTSLITAMPVAAQTTAPTEVGPPRAIFEGEPLDLSRGWGDAAACLVSEVGVNCFRSEAELDEYMKSSAGEAGMAAAATCSTPLRLYDGTYRTGSMLAVATRGIWLNLSLYGFDNQTSSYEAGSCNIELASSTNGGGARYPRCLNAHCIENVMASGWNNVVSSVYNK